MVTSLAKIGSNKSEPNSYLHCIHETVSSQLVRLCCPQSFKRDMVSEIACKLIELVGHKSCTVLIRSSLDAAFRGYKTNHFSQSQTSRKLTQQKRASEFYQMNLENQIK